MKILIIGIVSSLIGYGVGYQIAQSKQPTVTNVEGYDYIKLNGVWRYIEPATATTTQND